MLLACLHTVNIHQILMKKFIFSTETGFSDLWNNSLRTYDLIFEVHISDIAWDFLFALGIFWHFTCNFNIIKQLSC